MKTIYILLTRSTTILSRLVHFVTEDTYTHAALAFDEELKTLYSCLLYTSPSPRD